MASNQTEYLGLSQWKADDQILREEFNKNNMILDTYLSRNRYVIGTYHGSGQFDQNTFVDLGFEPSLVIITCLGQLYEDRTTIFTPNDPIYYNGVSLIGRTTESGFEVGIGRDSSGQAVPPYTNTNGSPFLYLAFR